MRTHLVALALLALCPLASAHDDDTYWNYSWYGAGVDDEGSPVVYRESCAGYGHGLPGSGFGLYPFGSAPDPRSDCDPETRRVLLSA